MRAGGEVDVLVVAGAYVLNWGESDLRTLCPQFPTCGHRVRQKFFNVEKFRQHEPLRDFLLASSGSVIVEASPYDRIWGIGLRHSDEQALDPTKWRGNNLLGFALMDVRSALMKLAR